MLYCKKFEPNNGFNVNDVIGGDDVTCVRTLSDRRPGTQTITRILNGQQSGNYNLTRFYAKKFKIEEGILRFN